MKRGGLACLTLCLIPGCVSEFGIPGRNEAFREIDNSRGYVAVCPGFLGLGSTGDLVLEMRKNGYACYVSANSGAHFELMQRAYAQRKLTYAAAHSMGAEPALELANLCEDKKVAIRRVFLFDPFSQRMIPENVAEVEEFRSSEPYVFKLNPYDGNRLENPNITRLNPPVRVEANHLNLPSRAAKLIAERLAKDFSDAHPNYNGHIYTKSENRKRRKQRMGRKTPEISQRQIGPRRMPFLRLM
jgi:hypothetical protein